MMKYKKWFFYVSIFSTYLIVEGICYLGLWYIEKANNITYAPRVSALSQKQKIYLREFLKLKKGKHVGQDPVLGWVAVSGVNSAGIRDDREYEKIPATNTIRISAFGDSFTFGEDVELRDTWAKQLTAIDSSIEVLNYGVGAYGFDQAYLRFLQIGNEYNPHIVFIGFMSENIARNVNVFRPFYSRMYNNAIFTKPRFKVRDGELFLLKNPLSTFEDYEHLLLNDGEVLAELGENDYHYQIKYCSNSFDFLPSVRFAKIFLYYFKKKSLDPIFKMDGMYAVESEAYQVTIKLFDEFYQKVLENGALPVILIFPDINDQRSSRKNKERRYTPLLNYFQSKKYYFIDTLGALKPHESLYTVDDFTENWGHYSPIANKLIAKYINRHLINWNIKGLPSLKNIIQAESTRLNIKPK